MAGPVPDGQAQDALPPEAEHRRNPWIWISALLALVAIGVAIWALSLRSDRDEATDELARTQQQLASAQQTPGPTPEPTPTPAPEDESGGGRAVLTAGAVAAVTALVKDLQEELGATQQDLETAEQDVAEATKQAEAADKAATKAKQEADQAEDATDKAEAEADQAEAEVEAAESRAAIARDCARAYVTAIGELFEGDGPEDQADHVREQLQGITAQCRSAFAGA
jgi:DNA repair exonuclease SbcCD ATPase subunit